MFQRRSNGHVRLQGSGDNEGLQTKEEQMSPKVKNIVRVSVSNGHG